MMAYISESLFVYKQLNLKTGVTQKNVFDALPSSDLAMITLANLKSSDHWFTSQSSYTGDIINLCLICQILKPKVVFEIGTLMGYTALHFALNTPSDSKIYTLDLPKNEDVQISFNATYTDDFHINIHSQVDQYCFEKSAVASRITALYGDSAKFDFSPFHGKVDFFFIDGAHSYQYARSDTFKALKCCHAGSVIAWHDFGRTGVNGVSRWILEFSKDHEIFATPGGSLAYMIVKK